MANRTSRSGRRTDYEWANMGDFEGAQDLAQSAAFGATSLVFSLPRTVTRVRGAAGVYLDAGAADESAMILLGLGVFDTDQIAAGAAPELFTGASDDASWIWQGQLYVHSGVGILAGGEEGQFDRIVIDTKAMRRVKPSEQLAFVFHAPASLVNDQAGTFDLTWFCHVLLGS